MTTTRRNPLAMLVSIIAAITLAFGMAPTVAFANPANLTAEEIAKQLADAAETPVMTLDASGNAETVVGETLLTFENDDDATAFIHETEQRDGLYAEVLVDDIEGATIVIVTSENAASTGALVHAAEKIDSVTAQPNYVYTLPNEVTTPKPIGATTQALALGSDETESPLNFPDDPHAAEYQYQFLPVGDGTSKSGSNILEAWDLVRAQSALSPVSVSVVDTGINMNHEDLQDNVDYVHAYNVFTEDADVTDLVGHGSMVAGIIGATANNGKGIAGVADAVSGTVSVVPVKVFTDSGETYSHSVVQALDYLDELIENGTVDDLRVVNLSVGMRGHSYLNPDHVLYRAVNHLTFDHDVLVVGAGGNGDDDNQAIMDPMYPSDYEACLSVTALTETGANAYFSDYNQNKDISAPGWEIAGPSEEGNGYMLSSGTSHAAPIVSGVAALMLIVDPTLSPAEAIDIIKSTAVPIPDRSENDWCDLSGSAGALDAGNALRETLKRAGVSEGPTFTDVKSWFWYANYVTKAVDLGIMSGTGNGYFEPEKNLSREQAAQVLYNMFGNGEHPQASSKSDVNQSEWYKDAVNWALARGVMAGVNDDRFGVGESTTREQFAQMLANYLGVDLKTQDLSVLDDYPDLADISDWAEPAMAWAVENGVLFGVGDGIGGTNLKPQNDITRAEAATMFVNAIDNEVLNYEKK